MELTAGTIVLALYGVYELRQRERRQRRRRRRHVDGHESGGEHRAV